MWNIFVVSGKAILFHHSLCTSLLQVLYEQFKFFLNLYFLVMASSQFIPEIRIGYLYTYWGPLVSFFSLGNVETMKHFFL